MSGATDEREEAINEIAIYMMQQGIPVQDAKNALYMILGKYEIMSRCTELVEMQQGRNENLLNRFLIAKTVKGCTERTIKYYGTSIPKILMEIGKTVDDITAEDIRYYMAKRSKRDKVSNTTVANEMRNLSSFLQWLHAEEIIQKNPMLRVERIKQVKARKEAFTEEEVEQLRLAARGEREQMMLEVLLSTGCRVSEFVGIRLDEIEGEKVLVHGKGQKDRYVYLNTKARIMLDRYLAERKDDNPYLNPAGKFGTITFKKGATHKKSIRNQIDWWKNPDNIRDGHLGKETPAAILKKIARKAGVEQANPHKFRRTCATLALRRGMPIEQVSRMLGHEQLDTTKIYLDLSEDELQQAHKKYVI